MKTSLAHIPENKRNELKLITEKIVESIPQTQMIILYGSYARGNFVVYEENDDFGTPSSFASDFDLLVLTNDGINPTNAQYIINRLKYGNLAHPYSTHVQAIVENITDVNKYIADRRYFFTDIKKEGILLYDSGKFQLERRRQLDFQEIKKIAKDYYVDNYQSAYEFYETAKWTYDQGWYKKSSFNLHQCAENSFKTVRLTFTLYGDRTHDLEMWLGYVKNYSLDGYYEVFPLHSKEDKRLFELLQKAYIHARYNRHFNVTKEDIDALMPNLKKLLDLTKKLCEERIEAYDSMK